MHKKSLLTPHNINLVFLQRNKLHLNLHWQNLEIQSRMIGLLNTISQD